MSGYQVPACPRCLQNGKTQGMAFVPGEVELAPDGKQLRRVFCPSCSYLPKEGDGYGYGDGWWALFKAKRQKCSSCGHEEIAREYVYGGASTSRPTAAPEYVEVDRAGGVRGLGVQGIPLEE